MSNQVQKFNNNEVAPYDEVSNAGAKAKEFKDRNTVIIDGKPKKNTAEKQLIISRIIAALLALILVLLLVVVLVALPKTIKLMDRVDTTIQKVDKTINEATEVIEDIDTAVNGATEVINSIDVDGINQSIDSLNTITSAIANPFGIFK